MPMMKLQPAKAVPALKLFPATKVDSAVKQAKVSPAMVDVPPSS